MFKFLNQCFARLRFWKSVSSKSAVAPSSRFRESETLFQDRSRAKHWFKNLNILERNLLKKNWRRMDSTIIFNKYFVGTWIHKFDSSGFAFDFNPSKAWNFNPSENNNKQLFSSFRRVEISSFRRVEIKRQNRWLKL